MRYLIKQPDNFLNSLNNEINTVLHRSFDSIFPEYMFHKEIEGLTMPIEIKEYDNEYKLKVEVPGIAKENLDIDIDKNHVTISATKDDECKDEHAKFHKCELRYGHFERTVYYPEDIDVESAKAELKHGILFLNLPKIHKEETSTKKLEIHQQ